MTIEQDINLGFFHVAMDRAETAEARVRTLEATIFSISEANDMLLDRAERAEAERDALRRVVATWVSASDKFERAVATYNARVMFCRAHELGLHNVDTEYGLMENARRARDATLAPMLSAARAALKEGK